MKQMIFSVIKRMVMWMVLAALLFAIFGYFSAGSEGFVNGLGWGAILGLLGGLGGTGFNSGADWVHENSKQMGKNILDKHWNE